DRAASGYTLRNVGPEIFLRIDPYRPRSSEGFIAYALQDFLPHRSSGSRRTMPGAASSSTQTNRCPASLLLPRDVFAAVNYRAKLTRLGARFRIGCVFDGRLSVAAEDRFRDSGAADGWSRLRLPTRLVRSGPVDCLCKVRPRCG